MNYIYIIVIIMMSRTEVVEIAERMMDAWLPLRCVNGHDADWEAWWELYAYPDDYVEMWDEVPEMAEADLAYIAEHQDDEPEPIECPGIEILFPED